MLYQDIHFSEIHILEDIQTCVIFYVAIIALFDIIIYQLTLLPALSPWTMTYGNITLPVPSETINTKGGVSTSSIMAFLYLGPDVLKAPDSNLPNVKMKIDNEVDNVTQIVEGTKSTNVVMRVEISKALACQSFPSS